MPKMLLQIFAVALVLTVGNVGTAGARGGGGADILPSVGYPDLPPYHPKPACHQKRWCGHLRYAPQFRR